MEAVGWRRIRPEEYVMAGFGAALALLVQFGTGGRFGWGDLGRQLLWRFSHYGRHHISPLTVWIVLGLAVAAGGWLLWRGRAGRIALFLRDAAPFLVGYLAYVLLRDLIPYIRPTTVDARLGEMESALLGTPSYVAIPRALGCAFLDYLLMACYTSHYYVPPAFAIFLAWRDREAFRHFMLALSIAWAIGYLGYVAVPAVGPKFAFANYDLWRVTPGVSPVARVIDSVACVTRDCFPSMHVAWSLLTLWAARPFKVFFAFYAPVVAGLALATLYFGFHYLIDLPAGALVAAAAILSARRIRRWWAPSSTTPSDLVS